MKSETSLDSLKDAKILNYKGLRRKSGSLLSTKGVVIKGSM